MKGAYPAILHKENDGSYYVDIPSLKIGTQGRDITDAIFMARDAIGLWGITQEDLGFAIPVPGTVPECPEGDMITLVDVDFDAYRRANEVRSVRKSVTIPSYLNDLAEKAGINFSQILQDGLRQRLGVV